MKTKKLFRELILIISIALLPGMAAAQHAPKGIAKADSLINAFEDIIFTTFNDTYFWKHNEKPVFTLLKADIDAHGKISYMQFSDSADSSFVAAFERGKQYQQAKAILQAYAQVQKYRNLSIIIPVYYENDFEVHPEVKRNYEQIEGFMEFSHHTFSGTAVMRSPVLIRVLAWGNS